MAELYDRIGKDYDTTRRADPEIVRRLAHHLQRIPGDRVLDVACGTGNYTMALSQLGMRLTGVDVSEEMVTKAREKSTDVHWVTGDVNSLAFDNSSFQGATCVLAIHHFDDLIASFREVHRVLADGGRFVIFTSSPEQMQRYWLNAYFPRAMKLSIDQMPSVEVALECLRHAEFSIVGTESFLVEPDLTDFFLYSGKFQPHMYLNPAVRSGISTFANLASAEEIETGCRKLQNDIDTSRIHLVMNEYASTLGDYMFIVAETPKR